jgi:purine-binding chemotaxis protein CheW
MATKTYVTFTVNNQLYGLDISYVREINRQMDSTPVPQATSYVHGLINLRGQIVTVLDLKSRLGLGDAHVSDHTHNVILKTEHIFQDNATGDAAKDRVGLLVDEIGDIVSADECDIEPPPANTGLIDGKYLDSVVKVNAHQVITILSVKQLLEIAA